MPSIPFPFLPEEEALLEHLRIGRLFNGRVVQKDSHAHVALQTRVRMGEVSESDAVRAGASLASGASRGFGGTRPLVGFDASWLG